MNIFGLAKANSQAKSEKSATQEKPQVNQIEIAQNSNPQTEVNPSKSVFDLDIYRKNGCTDDDKNKEGAKAIRKDIMDFYGIDSNDTNLEEKLTRIYLDIMEDNKNDILSKNCKDENITYDGDNEEEFNENVELMMAHMSHDGTSKGDDVHLSEVDFSDIEYSSETKTGSIEEKPVENGAEYIVYDSEGNVVKCIYFDKNC